MASPPLPEPLRAAERIQGWMRPRELAFLYGIAHTMPSDARVVEIGSWKGRSTVAIAEGLRDVPGARLTAVDTFGGEANNADQLERFGAELEADDVFGEFTRNTSGYDHVDVIRATSLEGAERIADESLDWVFIDAEHSIERLTEDIRAWYPKLKPGGLISGHDYLHLEVRLPVLTHFGTVPYWQTIWFTHKDGPLRERRLPAAASRARLMLRERPEVERGVQRAWAVARGAVSRR